MKFRLLCATAVLLFFIAGLLYLLRFKRVDNLGAYSIPFGDRPSHSICYRQLLANQPSARSIVGMTIVQFVVSSFLVTIPLNWSVNWAWGVPLIVLTVVIHVLGLGFIKEKAFRISSRTSRRRHHTAVSLVVIGTVTLSATVLHAIEAGLWAVAYVFLHALADYRSAVLYSLNAVTSYGHTNLELAQHWHLMGALEALNGWLLFGLTTAFLFAVIDKVWMPENK